MAVTSLANIIDPEVMSDQVSALFPDKLVLAGISGLVKVDPGAVLGDEGSVYTIPSWNRIGSFAAMTEGTPLVTGAITTHKERCTVQRAGIALGVYDTAKLVSHADPMSEIAPQIAERAARYIDSALVVTLENTPNTYDISAVGSGLIDQNTVMAAMALKIGDNYMNLLGGGGAFICHSKVYKDLMEVGAIQQNYISQNDVLRTGLLSTISGLPVYVSDLVTTTTVSSVLYYNSYIVGNDALGLFYQRALNVETDRDILAKEDVISADMHFATHLYGYDEVGSAVVAQDNKSIRAIKIKTK